MRGSKKPKRKKRKGRWGRRQTEKKPVPGAFAFTGIPFDPKKARTRRIHANLRALKVDINAIKREPRGVTLKKALKYSPEVIPKLGEIKKWGTDFAVGRVKANIVIIGEKKEPRRLRKKEIVFCFDSTDVGRPVIHVQGIDGTNAFKPGGYGRRLLVQYIKATLGNEYFGKNLNLVVMVKG